MYFAPICLFIYTFYATKNRRDTEVEKGSVVRGTLPFVPFAQ